MPRAIWKGAITFGLVLVPVALFPASQDEEIDFDWLDKRSMDPVGYKRINKRTGKEIAKDDIVKGVKQANGDYVLLSDDEIAAAYPKTTQTIEIEAFVDAKEIALPFIEKPYWLEPVGKAEKVYALLREAMLQAGVVGIARVVMHTKEHLAALIPNGAALMLNTLRWASEIRPADELALPAAGRKALQLKDSELAMARQLIGSMTGAWKPDDYADKFTDALRELIAKKVAAGKTETVAALEEAPAAASESNVVDLTELLRKSLGQRASGAERAPAKASKAASKPAAKKAKLASTKAASASRKRA